MGVRWVDFFLFPRLKSIIKRARFADVAVIQERVTAVLRSIHKEAFAEIFQKFYELCRAVCCEGWQLFWLSIKLNFVSSVLFVLWYHSPNVLVTPRIIRKQGAKLLCYNWWHKLSNNFFQRKGPVVKQEVGWKGILFVAKYERTDWRWKYQFEGHIEYYVLTLMKVGNSIQSPNPTTGCHEIQQQFVKLLRDQT
jgi:hypothetical protein